MKKVYAIITSDWHLTDNTPICRTDDYYSVQWKKVDFISNLQKEHNCIVLHAGDLFDYWKPSLSLLADTIDHLPENFYTIYGNHDLPQHNIELKNKSGIHLLEKAGKLKVLEGTHWKGTPVGLCRGLHEDYFEFLIWHILTYQGQKPWIDCIAPKALRLLLKYPQFKMIITGDNHKTFVEELNGRRLVNPGSLMRMKTNQIEHKPCIFLWHEDNSIEQIFIPIEKDVISREHIEVTKQREDRIEAFIQSLNKDWEVSNSFEENLQRFIEKNKVNSSIIEIINQMNPNTKEL